MNRLISILLVFIVSTIFAQSNVDSLLNLSLEELMTVKVKTGNIVGLEKYHNPSSITVISSDDITQSPARNLLDLIEYYVPGAMFINHSTGPRLVMRGIQGNYKMLLLVNGKNLNNKAFFGANIELKNWDLNDIEKIEVIRNPGSTTYGPGASGGVINIVTKLDFKENEQLKVGAVYNAAYGSKGAYAQYFDKYDNIKLASHFSIVSSTGVTNPIYYRGGNGYVDRTDAQTYMGDFPNKPQIKAHLQLVNSDNWNVWTRYTNSGQTLDVKKKDEFESGLKDSYFSDNESFVLVVEKTVLKAEKLNITAKSSFDSENSRAYGPVRLDVAPDNYLNRFLAYSENELSANLSYDYKLTENIQLAAITEYSYDYIKKPWFESSDRFLWASQVFILPNAQSPYITSGVLTEENVDVFSSGWGVNTFSGAFESSIKLKHNFGIVYSFRVDKNVWIPALFSNRIAVTKKVNDFSFKLLGQRSLRMNTLSNLYVTHEFGGTSRQESLDALELISGGKFGKLEFTHSVFVNSIEHLSFNGLTTNAIGKQTTLGNEIELYTKGNNYQVGVSYSYVKQLDWKMEADLKTGSFRQSVSYSDYLYNTQFLSITNTGNDMMNWANQSIKLNGRYNFKNGLYATLNCMLYFGYQGYKDELLAYENAYKAVDVNSLSEQDRIRFETEYNQFTDIVAELNADNIFGLNYALSSLVGYKTTVGKSIINFNIGLQNLTNNYKRYSFSPGSNATYPNRVRFVVEPISFYTSLSVSF